MKAISLWAPWGTLLHTPTPSHRMVKRFETRSWPCPPSIIGQRVAIHQAKKLPPNEFEVGAYACWNTTDGCSMLAETVGRDGYTNQPIADLFGDWLPLGCVIASGVITASLPIVGEWPTTGDLPGPNVPCIYVESNRVPVAWLPGEREGAKIADQLPYGDFTPGRFAWLFDDVKPTTERCPWCWGGSWEPRDDNRITAVCRVCKGEGHCDPIPARGRQRFWNWEPS